MVFDTCLLLKLLKIHSFKNAENLLFSKYFYRLLESSSKSKIRNKSINFSDVKRFI